MFNDEGLKLFDCVLVMEYCMMVIVLEVLDNLLMVLFVCKMCIERLNFFLVVENCFIFEIKKSFCGLFSK